MRLFAVTILIRTSVTSIQPVSDTVRGEESYERQRVSSTRLWSGGGLYDYMEAGLGCVVSTRTVCVKTVSPPLMTICVTVTVRYLSAKRKQKATTNSSETMDVMIFIYSLVFPVLRLLVLVVFPVSIPPIEQGVLIRRCPTSQY